MKKVILVDGNNLLFRSYYATAYTGNIMRNSKGFPTNGLYGFVNMINKILNETPDDLKMQFPVAKEILTELGIKYLEVVGYEADDIIGTYAKMIDDSEDYQGLIVSSDKDLLQLISDKVTVKLLKSKDYVMMDHDTFVDTYGIEPIRMIDLKGLMGDASDNIPGVKGIGEKTALKLLKTYDTIDNLYSHIDELKGATYNKLVSGRDSAFSSRDIATIYREVPVDFDLEDIKYKECISDKLIELYNELDFHSFIKKIGNNNNSDSSNNNIDVSIIYDTSNLVIDGDVSLYLDLDNDNYHKANILGISIYNNSTSIYIPGDKLDNLDFIRGNIYTYDAKKLYVSFRKKNVILDNIVMDIMIGGYLLNYNVNDDIVSLARDMGYDIDDVSSIDDIELNTRARLGIQRAKFIYDIKDKIVDDMKREEVYDLYENIEMPLAIVLGKMEINGINCCSDVLDEMGIDIVKRIKEVESSIYDLCGCEFNVGSPKQLGDVLFDKLGLPHGKKGKSGNYSTDETTLSKFL